MQTEQIDQSHKDLDLRSTVDILETLLGSQQQAIVAVRQAAQPMADAIESAAERLQGSEGRIILLGAGASGRIAVQDGAELWPTFGWPHDRLLLVMAGGDAALTHSIEGVEDDESDAIVAARDAALGVGDVVIAVAASGRSAWTCRWLEEAQQAGALGIGLANNADSRLLLNAQCPIFLDTGPEVLAGSTRMAAGTAQKIALNLFSTTLMIRLNRTHGNLMVDMAAVNNKLDTRRMRLLQAVLPELPDNEAQVALAAAGGWIKLAALLALGLSERDAREQLAVHRGSLRSVLDAIAREPS